MISVPPKTPQLYLTQYKSLLDSCKQLNDTELDYRGDDPDLVVIQQPTKGWQLVGTLRMEANLKDGQVSAAYTAESGSLPSTKVSYRPEGPLLWVEESYLPSVQKDGKTHRFSIDTQTGTVANESTSSVPRGGQKDEGKTENLQAVVRNVAQHLQPLGWLVAKPWESPEK